MSRKHSSNWLKGAIQCFTHLHLVLASPPPSLSPPATVEFLRVPSRDTRKRCLDRKWLDRYYSRFPLPKQRPRLSTMHRALTSTRYRRSWYQSGGTKGRALEMTDHSQSRFLSRFSCGSAGGILEGFGRYRE